MLFPSVNQEMVPYPPIDVCGYGEAGAKEEREGPSASQQPHVLSVRHPEGDASLAADLLVSSVRVY